jgi:hypothetical protein
MYAHVLLAKIWYKPDGTWMPWWFRCFSIVDGLMIMWDYKMGKYLAGLLHCCVWLQINASVGEPLIQQEGNKERLPVVIFSHGMWACRTTYTLACCDMASHGYSTLTSQILEVCFCFFKIFILVHVWTFALGECGTWWSCGSWMCHPPLSFLDKSYWLEKKSFCSSHLY